MKSSSSKLWQALARNEWLKMKRRPAAMVCLGLSAAVLLLVFASSLRSGDGFAFPEAWEVIVAGAPQVPALIGAILLMLLVANEFEWRTARQNVIDGLSREEWFRAKLLLVPMLLVLFLGTQLVLGVIFGLVGSGGSLSGLLPGLTHWKALGGVAVGFVGYSSLALTIALAVRSAGVSVGVFFLYALVVEELLASGLTRLSGALEPVVRHFPLHAFDVVMRYARLDPEPWGAPRLFLVSVGWILLLLGGSYLVFRRRDL